MAPIYISRAHNSEHVCIKSAQSAEVNVFKSIHRIRVDRRDRGENGTSGR